MATKHRRTTTRRWTSAGALLFMPLLFSASGASFHNFAIAGETGVPAVPSTSYDQPASVQPAVAFATNASAPIAVADVAAGDIPAVALAAYRRTESLLSDADPQCKLSWTLVAAIGRVESDHGRTGGNALDAAGVARPGIYGPTLDGAKHTATISDTDKGKLDKDARWDRAVGPMQFIPGTWSAVAIDSDVDGKADPQNIYDAAAAAGVYLCAGPDDLATDGGARRAVRRYNRSSSYVDEVLAIARKYAKGDFSSSTVYAAAPVQNVQMRPSAETMRPITPMKVLPTSVAPKTVLPKKESSHAADPAAAPPTTEPVDPPPATEPVDPPPSTEPTDPPAEDDPPATTPVQPPTEPEAKAICLATGSYLAESDELGQCVLALIETGSLP